MKNVSIFGVNDTPAQIPLSMIALNDSLDTEGHVIIWFFMSSLAKQVV